MLKKLNTLISGIIGGGAISLGGMVFLSSDNKIIGALFFTIGLFTICTFNFNLFTGKICYIWENKISYFIDTLIIWVGNLTGCFLTSNLFMMTRIGESASFMAADLLEIKLSDQYLSVFILAIFCNICIYIAVDGFKNNKHEIGKYLSIFLGVMVFILCGFEHCVANMFYISMAGLWSGTSLVFILVNTLGNALGGWIIPAYKLLLKK